MTKSIKTLLAVGAAILAVLIIVLFLLSHSKNTPTWQEQYDLGIRYLSDGNYQEAIIAFTAAIEIDAMRPEAYLKAAEAYEAIGDSEAARAILEKGYAATGDKSLRPREETPAPEPPEETAQEWILDDFISAQELTIGNVPFYKYNIDAAYEVYPPISDYNPHFWQAREKDIVSVIYVYYSDGSSDYPPEFRGITMGMTIVEVLKSIGFTEYAIQEVLSLKGDNDYPVGIYNDPILYVEVRNNRIFSSYMPHQGSQNVILGLYDDTEEKRVSVEFIFEEDILHHLSMHVD